MNEESGGSFNLALIASLITAAVCLGAYFLHYIILPIALLSVLVFYNTFRVLEKNRKEKRD